MKKSDNMTTMKNWKDELSDILPFLGHRNWIVVTDMAYPLQAQQGIKTIYTDESYMDVLSHVYSAIEAQPHIKPLIYQDSELKYVEEGAALHMDSLYTQMTALLGDKVESVPHETLISRLDEMSRIFNVVILKTTLTIPYTSTFFELDCKYWDKEKEEALRQKL
jgi:D-ribose pyranose/furanose isomerase RbsD